jgi:choice-of-anchor B domain-containing protein
MYTQRFTGDAGRRSSRCQAHGRRRTGGVLGLLVAVVALVATAAPAAGHDEHDPDAKGGARWVPQTLDGGVTAAAVTCQNGFAGEYPCQNVDLLAQLPLNTIGGGSGNDIWGWTDPQTGREYALLGRSSGTSFVDITNPESPVYLGNLPTATVSSSWRDVKVHNNHAYIVSEASGHGLQVFNLTRLRNVTNPPVTFTADARNTSFGNAHNIAINEDSGFAYVIGSNTCSGGPRMFNLSNPTNPTFAGCVSGDGYTHDTQAVIYQGPDAAHQGRELLFNANEDTLTIFDVTNKSNPVQLARQGYSGRGYTHQGWLTEDHRYFLLDDELDEQNFGHNTRTRVWNVQDVDNPVLIGWYSGPTGAIDHNLYIRNNLAYQSNYTAGLRILDIANVTNPSSWPQVGFFDVHPANNNASFNGTWSNYPYFDSGVVIVSSIERGLFVLRPNFDEPPPPGETVFEDDFESAGGWTTNFGGGDTATTGQWERGDPEPTSYGGTQLQLGTTTSGVSDLVTGRLAGGSVGANDIDGGVTSITSPQIALPAGGTINLSLQYSFAHLNNATSADFFRVSVVGSTTATVFEQLGAGTNRSGAWGGANADISGFVGQTVRIRIEAADAAGGSLVEAGVDDLVITAPA